MPAPNPEYLSPDSDDESTPDSNPDSTRSAYQRILRTVDQLERNRDDRIRTGEADVEDDRQSLMKAMMKAKECYERVSNPSEALMDAVVTLKMSRLLNKSANDINISQKKFNYSEFARKIISQGKNKLDHTKLIELGHIFSRQFRRPPSLTYLLGSMTANHEVEVKEKKQRAQKVKISSDDREATRFTQLDTEGLSENSSNTDALTEQMVRMTKKKLLSIYKSNGSQPVDYFRFVIDPDSFGATVENVFYVSFLVKEGKVKIFRDQFRGLPVMEPMIREEEEEAENTDQNQQGNKQVVVNLCMSEWKTLKEALSITEATIKRQDKDKQRKKAKKDE